MSDFVIYTDCNADLPARVRADWGVKAVHQEFVFDGDETVYATDDIDIKAFYRRMREGAVARTAATNMDTFYQHFETELAAGKDVLYVGFSSTLSITFQSACQAAEELRERYPERKLICVDTLGASAGVGMLVYFAVEKKASGADIEETAAHVRALAPKLCHWFTVDDLVYLKRGGRVSPAVALVGGALGIKPIMHMDHEGCLTKTGTVRGRKAALQALTDQYMALAEHPGPEDLVYLCHADCEEDARQLAAMLHEHCGVSVSLTVDIGPAVGAHAGPGTLAVFFVGKER